jgi:E3 ubiquitin-protein ligase NRDP1
VEKDLDFVCYVSIFRLDITCENEGCVVIVKLDVLVNHLEECEFGPEKLIQCENGCGMTISKENLSVRFD